MQVYITNISKLLYLLGLRKSTPAYVSDTVSSLVIERMEMMDEQVTMRFDIESDCANNYNIFLGCRHSNLSSQYGKGEYRHSRLYLQCF